MPSFEKSILPRLEAHLGQMTRLEQKIAQYFLKSCHADDDLAAQSVATRLGVSVASLTRFAQKCGFKGYREFSYSYQAPQSTPPQPQDFHSVLAGYQEILNKTFSLIDMGKIQHIRRLMSRAKRVYFYGKGSSGMVAREMKFRFMRIGIICEAICDDDLIRMNSAMLDQHCLVIGISVSGKTEIICHALQMAKAKNAKTVLLTANASEKFDTFCDEVQLFAVRNHLENGRSISPQFPALIVFDILYADLMTSHKRQRDAIWEETYQALHTIDEGKKK